VPTVTACPQGHKIRSQDDRTTNGTCRKCHREDEQRRRRFAKAATGIVRMLEADGIVFFDPTDGSVLPYEAITAQITSTNHDAAQPGGVRHFSTRRKTP
jgi:hypothetical protein